MKNTIKKDVISQGWSDYTLLDSGNQMKLEQFGPYRLARFEPDTVWYPMLSQDEWGKADAVFSMTKKNSTGSWHFKHDFNHDWMISFKRASIQLSISKSRHIGIFPEQNSQWTWIEDSIKRLDKQPKILNLFAYSGIATVFAIRGGAEVTHIDSSKNAVRLAKKNLEINRLDERPCRWIVDDALKFVEKEIRRGKVYDGIILDPPLFGRGPKGEIWKFSRDIKRLIGLVIQLLTKNPLWLICTVYNIQKPIVEIADLISTSRLGDYGFIQYGSLIQKEQSAGREIKQASYARWSAEAWR